MNTIIADFDKIREDFKFKVKEIPSDEMDELLSHFIFNEFKIQMPEVAFKVYLEDGLWRFRAISYEKNGANRIKCEFIAEFRNGLEITLVSSPEDYFAGKKSALSESSKKLFEPLIENAQKNKSPEKIHSAMENAAKVAMAEFSMMIASVCLYIMWKASHVEYIERTRTYAPRGTSSSKRGSGSKDKVYTLDKIIRYVSKRKSKDGHHTITCDCWGVRGHYRRYKSGKVVFVKAFNKGKNRSEKPTDKTFVVV